MPDEIDRLQNFAAFGQFINSFANVESNLQELLRKLTGMSDAAARVICAGMRNSDLIARLRGLVSIPSIVDDEQKFRITRILDQFLVIAKTRDTLVHRSGFVTTAAVASFDFNSKMPHPREGIPYFWFTREILGKAISDLRAMSDEMQFVLHGEIMREVIARSELSDPDSFLYFESYKWQYKPPEPTILDHKSPEAPQ